LQYVRLTTKTARICRRLTARLAPNGSSYADSSVLLGSSSRLCLERRRARGTVSRTSRACKRGSLARHGLGSFCPASVLSLSMDTMGMQAMVWRFCGYGRVTARASGAIPCRSAKHRPPARSCVQGVCSPRGYFILKAGWVLRGHSLFSLANKLMGQVNLVR